MSTNPETSPRASLSSNCAVQTRRLARRGEKVLAVAAACALAAGIGLVLWAKALHGYSSAALEAKSLGLTYETAVSGKSVLWCVDHPANDVSYTDGKPSHAILWTNGGAVPGTTGPTSGSERCAWLVARVVERRPQGLVLEYLGRP